MKEESVVEVRAYESGTRRKRGGVLVRGVACRQLVGLTPGNGMNTDAGVCSPFCQWQKRGGDQLGGVS